MTYDAIIFDGETLADYGETETPAIRLNDLTQPEANVIANAAQRNGLFVCLLPCPKNG